MGHGITAVDRYGETRKNGQKAWHGLGLEIEAGLSAADGFKAIGLGWDTMLLPVQATIPGENDQPGTQVGDPDFFMHVRLDTKESLGVVGKDYKVISNQFHAEFADSLLGADAAISLETAGSLRRGRRVFCSMKLPQTIEVVKDDVLDLYIIVSNAHDGSGGFNCYGSSIRPVCANTLGWSERELYRGVSFAHKGDVAVKVEMARAALGIMVKQTEFFEAEVRSLANARWTKGQIAGYFGAIYTRMYGEIPAELEQKERERREEHKSKTLTGWHMLLEDKKQQIAGIENTAWAAYNAFSQWSDHERGRFGTVQESDARVHSNLFGASASDKRKAFTTARQLIGSI